MRLFLFSFLVLSIIAFGQSRSSVKAKLIDFTEGKIPAYCGFEVFSKV